MQGGPRGVDRPRAVAPAKSRRFAALPSLEPVAVGLAENTGAVYIGAQITRPASSEAGRFLMSHIECTNSLSALFMVH